MKPSASRPRSEPEPPIVVDIRDPRCPPDIETVVRHKALDIEAVVPALSGVKVIIERAPTRGNGPCRVTVELDVPGGDVVVHQGESADIQLAVMDAMDAAARLLDERFGHGRRH
jgi:hypothetical protein